MQMFAHLSALLMLLLLLLLLQYSFCITSIYTWDAMFAGPCLHVNQKVRGSSNAL